MLRKSMMFFATLLIVSGAFAAPSVKKLGTAGVSSSATKSTPVVSKIKASSPSADSLQAKAAVAPVSKDVSADTGSRLAGLNTRKTISSGRITTPPVTTGFGEVSAEEFAAAVDRIDVLENSVVTGVKESGTGNYVSDVSVGENNKLTVTKTRLLYAPVRQGTSDTIVSDAEIWVVK